MKLVRAAMLLTFPIGLGAPLYQTDAPLRKLFERFNNIVEPSILHCCDQDTTFRDVDALVALDSSGAVIKQRRLPNT